MLLGSGWVKRGKGRKRVRLHICTGFAWLGKGERLIVYRDDGKGKGSGCVGLHR